MIHKIVQEAYTAAIVATETKAKDDCAHQRRDLEMIVNGLKGLSDKEVRIAAIVICAKFGNHFPIAAQEKLMQIGFEADMKDINRVTEKVMAIMNYCSERVTHQQRRGPLSDLLSLITGNYPDSDEEEPGN